MRAVHLYLNKHEVKELLKALDGPSTTSLTLASVYERLREQLKNVTRESKAKERDTKSHPWRAY